MQVEAAFSFNRITSDESKFRHVVLNLDQSTFSLVADIVTSPLEREKYEAIKGRLVSVLEETTAQCSDMGRIFHACATAIARKQ